MLKRMFISQAYNRPTYKNSIFPIYETNEFDFFRCLEFNESFYGRTASELFNNNLRMSKGRYSKLFPNQKISYWADSPETAIAEIKKHGAGTDILTFWAYDDSSSAHPIWPDQTHLTIIDGRKCGIQNLIDKADNEIELTEDEQNLLNSMLSLHPDCLAYDSRAFSDGENYIFFEKGYKKLALKKLSLYLGSQKGRNKNEIVCAVSCDYTPYLESYGDCFMPKIKVQKKVDYLTSTEYLSRVESHSLAYKKHHKKGKCYE